MTASFRTVIEVGAGHLEQARAVDRLFQDAIAPATVNFDFEHIREAAAAVPGSEIVRMVRGWRLQEEAPVMVMVLSLKEAVRQALPQESADARFWDTVERELLQALTGLAAQDGSPGLSYYDETPDHTSYYRDLFFALQDTDTDDHLYAIACCIDVTLGVDKTRAGALAPTDVVPFSLHLNAVVLRQHLPLAV
ncbi:Type-2Aa cytolytic delta-endotoxin [Streptomyces alkaliterrae]|uniref:Type-2Aa cytolytic delta-endotoxin n=1 Tax=Streptomyces alkaliterrae TaxID=2213162 RepID=A0A5P0YTW0_9ACTN|nr:Type-2Aa cytolytic delta-endotoxin [Streptomyces alkaliterrae]MBB1258252.1 Type-2Aa cytolytic delta-endotoxin [Streptomyces alkaliterrae]MQS03735.1 Type-2Aa cytolytic delta-endotoxin [Streptomyces alkaliterrae]